MGGVKATPGLKGPGEKWYFRSLRRAGPCGKATGRSGGPEGCSTNTGREQERNPGPLLLVTSIGQSQQNPGGGLQGAHWIIPNYPPGSEQGRQGRVAGGLG